VISELLAELRLGHWASVLFSSTLAFYRWSPEPGKHFSQVKKKKRMNYAGEVRDGSAVLTAFKTTELCPKTTKMNSMLHALP
jgi:hypothetical protein